MKKLRVSAFCSVATLLLAIAGAGVGVTQAVAAPAADVEPQACSYCSTRCGSAGGIRISGSTCTCCQVE